MEYGLGLLNYKGCWDDVAYAEQHGFHTAGFVESPLLSADPFVCMGLASQTTSTMRLGTFLAIPGLRDPTTLACGLATINQLASGRVFMATGTGYTARETLGLRSVAAHRMVDTARVVRGLLAGREVTHTIGKATRAIRFRHEVPEACVSIEHPVPIYVAGDGPKALHAAGEVADGLVVSLQNAAAMGNSPEVLASEIAQVAEVAAQSGRSFDDPYVMWSTVPCVLEPGESAISERALEHVGAAAMMAFHSYACHPEIGDFLPPPFQERIEIYKRNVLSRFPDGKHYQEAHAGHLARLLEGEAEVLTEEIIRMTCLVGTAEEIAGQLRRAEAAGLKNVSFWIPPHLTRSVIDDIERRVMPLM